MKKSLKSFELILAAMLVVSVLGASSASAKHIHSGSTSGTTFLTGTQIGTNAFDMENGTLIKCSIAVFDASYAGTTASELTVTPTYSACTFAGQAVSIDMGGCQYTVATPALVGDNDHYTSVMSIVCNTGGDIAITIPTSGCALTIKGQTPGVPTLNLTNITTGPKDIQWKWGVEGISYTTPGGGICGNAGKMKITGEVTFRGYSDAAHSAQVDLFIL